MSRSRPTRFDPISDPVPKPAAPREPYRVPHPPRWLTAVFFGWAALATVFSVALSVEVSHAQDVIAAAEESDRDASQWRKLAGDFYRRTEDCEGREAKRALAELATPPSVAEAAECSSVGGVWVNAYDANGARTGKTCLRGETPRPVPARSPCAERKPNPHDPGGHGTCWDTIEDRLYLRGVPMGVSR